LLRRDSSSCDFWIWWREHRDGNREKGMNDCWDLGQIREGFYKSFVNSFE
jgi:hypothetical protein